MKTHFKGGKTKRLRKKLVLHTKRFHVGKGTFQNSWFHWLAIVEDNCLKSVSIFTSETLFWSKAVTGGGRRGKVKDKQTKEWFIMTL